MQTLGHIREVIRNTSTPSWFTSVPKNFGDQAAGMIKADKWRSLITIYIPITLISLWGAGTPQADLKLILDNTMDLISAVYVGNLKHVHPTFGLRPNHHASFHIYNYLVLFGPVHSWWTFPFERLIGILQRLSSNHKNGELERTMLHSYLKGAKLHAWLSRPDCPPAIQECKVLLD
ncbi:hypothetical protein SCLCIDRAFT_138348, partial [Scleroderma citrinum Foug A]